MARPTADWKRTLSDFAATYLVPVAGVFLVVLIGLGILGLVGWLLRLAVPIAIVLLALAVVVLLAAEMVWRLITFNALIGLVSTYYAVYALIANFVPALIGALSGVLIVLALYFYGDPERWLQGKEKRTVQTALGQTKSAVLLSGTELTPSIGAVAFGALLLTILCWLAREHGTWDFLLSLITTLALGRAIVWISLEADTQTFYFWRPFEFLRQLPLFAAFFRWWHEVRRLLGIGIAHWAQDEPA